MVNKRMTEKITLNITHITHWIQSNRCWFQSGRSRILFWQDHKLNPDYYCKYLVWVWEQVLILWFECWGWHRFFFDISLHCPHCLSVILACPDYAYSYFVLSHTYYQEKRPGCKNRNMNFEINRPHK